VALYHDECLPQFETIVRCIHDAKAMAIHQVLHAGRNGGIDLDYCGRPSVVPQTLPHFRPPRGMWKEDIRRRIGEHVDAAKRVIRAGFDRVEVTRFMGYLLASLGRRCTADASPEYDAPISPGGVR